MRKRRPCNNTSKHLLSQHRTDFDDHFDVSNRNKSKALQLLAQPLSHFCLTLPRICKKTYLSVFDFHRAIWSWIIHVRNFYSARLNTKRKVNRAFWVYWTRFMASSLMKILCLDSSIHIYITIFSDCNS